MKNFLLAVFFIFFAALQAFCAGDMELANIQEINLSGVTDLRIIYSFEKVSVFTGTSSALVIKEYMTEIDKKYFAVINKYGNTVTIENGQAPIRPLFKNFNRHLEVFLPVSYKNLINIKTSSGYIELPDIVCSGLNLVSSSGNISANSITADVIHIKTSSGGFQTGKILGNADLITSSGNSDFGSVTGKLEAESSSGRINIDLINGSVSARTASGNITCAADPKAGNIKFDTASGIVRLKLPRSFQFNFSSRSASGILTAPFKDRLSNPVNDKDLTQGVISAGGSGAIPSVDIRTVSGNIEIEMY